MNHFKVMYKILRELEKNMGNEQFSVKTISAESLNIPYHQWEQLLILMQEDGYIKGLVIASDLSDNFRHIAEPIKPYITIRGLEYLADNSFMAKAKEALKMAGEIL